MENKLKLTTDQVVSLENDKLSLNHGSHRSHQHYQHHQNHDSNGNHLKRIKYSNNDSPDDTEVEGSIKENGHLKVDDAENAEQLIAESYFNIIKSIGEDTNREGLLKTPLRAAKAIKHFTKGYKDDLHSKRMITNF